MSLVDATSLPTLADVVAALGDVPLERILVKPPLGAATVDDLIAMNHRNELLCELIDGVLVSKLDSIVEQVSRPDLPVPALDAATFVERLGDVSLDRILVRPSIGTATEQDLLAINESKQRICELVDGTLVAKAVGSLESLLAGYLIIRLGAYVEEHNLGVVLGADGMLRLQLGLIRVPDVSFLSRDQFPDGQFPTDRVWALVPDLAVEIQSDTNRRGEIIRKRGEYFTSGTRLVWEFYPRTRTVEVYTSPTEATALDVNQTLDGGDLVPGFVLPLAPLFAKIERFGPPRASE